MKNTTIMKKATAAFLLALLPGMLSAQFVSFTNQSSLINDATMRSGNCLSVTDVNNDGLDDIVRLDNGTQLNYEIQNRDGSFTNHLIVAMSGGSAWGMAVADFDHNGIKDVVTDAGSGVNVVLISDNAGALSGVVNQITTSISLLQNVTIVDIDNDGWEDVFLCDDNQASKIFRNLGTGAGTFAQNNIINFNLNPGVVYGSDPADSGNYGSVWSDFDQDGDMDLYIAKCRQANGDTSDIRRQDVLYVNDGNGNFNNEITARGLRNGYQTWTATFGDVDNDGDFDIVRTNHDLLPYGTEILLNDGTGHFIDISATTGINTTSMTPYQSVFEDFDNDGWLDVFVTGTTWMMFRNNHDNTFTNITNLMSYTGGMVSFATGDLNHDGFIDLFTSYGDGYNSPNATVNDALYMNDGNDNHFITFNLEGTDATKMALGARVKIYGPWGTQVREVRSGESYGTVNSSQLHFGLGQSTSVDSVQLIWPGGQSQWFFNLDADQFVTVVENGCVITGNVVSGNPIFCTGQSTTLSAAAGFISYLWNDNSTGTSVTTSSTEALNVEVTDANGCTNISPTIQTIQNPDETPSLTINGPLEFCEGGSVTLSSSTASSYLWNNGAATQDAVINTAGDYFVTVQGTCAQFNSDTITVNVNPAPAPSATGSIITGPQSTTLTATGNNLVWYDAPTGGNVVGSGSSFTTPVLNTTTSYWVEDVYDYTLPDGVSGRTYLGTGGYNGGGGNYVLNFNVLEPCTLKSVKVYTDSNYYGVRTIELSNAGGVVLNSYQIDVETDSSRVTLNFPLTPGSYRLGTNGNQNNTSFGSTNPYLKRSQGATVYPYDAADGLDPAISITGNNAGSGGAANYYYFFDWEIEHPENLCISARTEVLVDVILSSEIASSNAGSIYPNPATTFINVNAGTLENVHVELFDLSGRLVERSFNKAAGNLFTLATDGMNRGVYMVRVSNESGSTTHKVVLQ
jgi:hypothetical protein